MSEQHESLASEQPVEAIGAGREDEMIERGLRVIHAYDTVRHLRDALTATTARLTGYDWNADPDSITKQQGDAFAAADKVFADLNAAVDAHPDIDLPECEACNGTGKIEEAARTEGPNQHSACVRSCEECDGCGFAPDEPEPALSPASPAQVESAGRVAVPLEATSEMMDAFYHAEGPAGPDRVVSWSVATAMARGNVFRYLDDIFANAYRAMLAAVPASPARTPMGEPQVLKGVGKINGDGWKDTTSIGEVVYVWNAEKPSPYAPGQYPRIDNEGWSASTAQYDFSPASVDEVRALAAPTPMGGDREHSSRCWGRTSFSDEVLHCYCQTAPTPMGGAWPEVTDAWAETYCELTGRDPDGKQVTFVDGGTVTTFRDIAKREIEAMLCAAPKPAVRAIAEAAPTPVGGEVEALREAASGVADALHDAAHVKTRNLEAAITNLADLKVIAFKAATALREALAASSPSPAQGGVTVAVQPEPAPDGDKLRVAVEALERIKEGGSWQGDTASDALAASSPSPAQGGRPEDDAARNFIRTSMGFTGPHDQDTPLQAAAREVGWMLSEMVDGAPWERRGQIQDALGRLAVTIDASPQPEAGEPVENLSEIISDAEIVRVHGYANFGSMTPREVVNDGILKTAVGYHCGHTQFSILRDHGLVTKPRLGSYDADLTKKGKAYARALYHRLAPPSVQPVEGK